MFEECAIDVVVRWISIYEPVEKESVEWKTPVLWRRSELMVFPDARVFQRMAGLLVCVEVVLRPCRIVVVRGRKGCEASKHDYQ